MLRLSMTRMTIFSPCRPASVLTRRSMGRASIITWMPPSCGRRRSEMSSPAMILMRLEIAGSILCGGRSFSKSEPSTRKRTRREFSSGSMWMSLAPSRTAEKMR